LGVERTSRGPRGIDADDPIRLCSWSESAVDTEHHLIVAHEVTNVGIDKGHPGSMAGKAREALGAETIKALAESQPARRQGSRSTFRGR
jgi:hypothetical protein